MKCNETLSKWCKNKHGASKIIDTFETYHPPPPHLQGRCPGLPAPASRLLHPQSKPTSADATTRERISPSTIWQRGGRHHRGAGAGGSDGGGAPDGGLGVVAAVCAPGVAGERRGGRMMCKIVHVALTVIDCFSCFVIFAITQDINQSVVARILGSFSFRDTCYLY
jgi:hypothetical protein